MYDLSIPPHLISPTLDLKDSFFKLVEDYQRFDPETGANYIDATHNFSDYIQSKEKESSGSDLRPGYVPQSTFWLVTPDRDIVGVSRLRHYLNPKLEIIGGHIGYDVPPSKRGQGYATILLTQTLKMAFDMSIRRVLLTVDQINTASIRVIEKNNGILSGTNIDPDTHEPQNLYWISL